MSSAITRFIGKKVVGRLTNAGSKANADRKNAGVTAPEKDNEFYMKTDRRTGKSKKTRKDVAYYTAQGISEHDAKILVTIKKRARRLDNGIDLGFTRCGYSTIIGLIPGIGDFADAGLAFIFVIRKARQVTDAPGKKAQLSQMVSRVAVRTVLGIIPIIGDIGITFYRANTMNADALEKWLLMHASHLSESQVDESDIDTVRLHHDEASRANDRTAQPQKVQQSRLQTNDDARRRFVDANDIAHG